MSIGLAFSGSFYLEDQALFSDLPFAVAPGQWTCLLGSSGIGKSTLLRLFAGLRTGGEFEGSISASNGLDAHTQIAYMAQTDLLFPWLTLRDNVMLGPRLRGEADDLERANALIEQVGLTQHSHKRMYELSGGMRQRTALARTLMEDKPIVLLDEPFSALDAKTRNEMQTLAFEVLSGKTVLLVTHDPAEAIRLSHRLFVMDESGVSPYPVPAAPPARIVNDSESLAALADLLLVLNS
jgi:putative hydroxymethylpyrimidine transport system ATP-binding protein